MIPIAPNIFLFHDTCNVYIVCSGHDAVLIDFGSGDVLDSLPDLGIDHVIAILMTHHHRDQGQGLPRAAAAGIPIFVPQTEQDLFEEVDAHWQSREIYNNYNMRQDRFSLLDSVRIAGTLDDYAIYPFGAHRYTVVPTPGHTIGSITLCVQVDEDLVAFTGDLIAAPGEVWSLAATQWTYNGAQGAAASILSLLEIKERQPDLLLPSHGEPMDDPDFAIDRLVERFRDLLRLRGQFSRLVDVRERPYEPITPHLLRHRQSFANHFVLLSEHGTALMIDFGYDFDLGVPSGSDRASRRPWLYSIPALKEQFDISRIDVAIPTHFHDDHVAGMNLLRKVEGTQIWAANLIADILEDPSRYDLPCLWYEPIRVDRRLTVEEPIQWEEYTLKMYRLPGHTRYAVAIEFEVDGVHVLATGDQYQGENGLELNYVYGNRFEASDYIKSAELYSRLQPDLILTGHWRPLWVQPGYFDEIMTMGVELERLHDEMLHHTPDLGAEGFVARLTPYQVFLRQPVPVEFSLELRNPFARPVDADVEIVMPPGWRLLDAAWEGEPVSLNGDNTVYVRLRDTTVQFGSFHVLPPPDFRARRALIAADITIDGIHFGQQGEMLITARDGRQTT